MKVIDIAKTILPQAKPKIIGIRPGEKLHEQMISKDDSNSTYEYDGYFKILPQINEWDIDNTRIKDGKRVLKGFEYTSDNNSEWMSNTDLQNGLKNNIYS